MTDYTTIGGLRDALSALDGAAAVYIDNLRPTALSSYRGYYDHLAIERDDSAQHERTELSGREEGFDLNMAGYGYYRPGHSKVRIKADPTVADLIAALDLAVGEAFEGYKGGQFYMDYCTDLWVSEYGSNDGLRVFAIAELPDRVDLLTREER